jgi:hypothetical protein
VIPDRIAIWPLGDARFGLDATFQGSTGSRTADAVAAALTSQGVPYTLRQELDGGWTVRLGPVDAKYVPAAVEAFVAGRQPRQLVG